MINKRLSAFLIVFLSLCAVGVYAFSLQPYAFPFIGRWQPSESPILIDDYGFQDIQNLRKWGKGLRGVSGHTKINTTVTSDPENYTTSYTEIDPSSRLTTTATTITALNMDADESAYVLRDFGIDSIDGDFQSQFQINMTTCDDALDAMYVFGTANAVGDLYTTTVTNSGDGLVAYVYGIGPGYGLGVVEYVAGSATASGTLTDLVASTDYYITIRRIRSEGTYGKLYLYCYTDSARKTQFSGSPITLTLTEDEQFRYFYPASSFNEGSGGYDVDGTVSNHTFIPDLKHGFHFKKDQPVESHVMVQGNGMPTPKILENTTAIPGAGNFSSTPVYTEQGLAGTARFSNAPQGNMLVADGEESLIWGGDEYGITSFITSTSTITYTGVTNPRDYSKEVNNTLSTSGNVAPLGGEIDSDCKLMLHLNGSDGSTTFTDSSASAHTVTYSPSTALDTDQKQFGSASVLMAKSTAYGLTIADSADWYMGTGNFTVDFWVRFKAFPVLSNDFKCYFEQWDDSDNHVVFANYGKSQLFFQIYDGAANVNLTGYPGTMSINTWYHIALVRDSDVFTIYFNGNSVGTKTITDDWPDLAGALRIGAGAAGLYQDIDNSINGWLDEFRVSKGVARWSTNFSVPDRQYSEDTPYWAIGTTRALQGLKYSLDAANSYTSNTMSGWQWNGSSWTGLTLTDNTSALSADGTVSFSSTVGTSIERYLEGLALYWYQFYIPAGSATISNITADAPMQNVGNTWDGSTVSVAAAKLFEDSTYKDYTDEVNADDSTTTMILDDLLATEYLTLGFTEPQQGFIIYAYPSFENTNAAALTVSYNFGDAWEEVTSLVDGTAEPATDSLGKTGTISFRPPTRSEEFEKTIADEVPLYYYKLQWDATLDAECEVFHITGIPAPGPVPGYVFPGLFQGRSWLFNEKAGNKNKAVYSVYNAPDIWNGSDSGELYFGAETALTASATLYNVFRAGTGYEMMLVTKSNETYRVFGDGPTNWETQQMSDNVGCVAPLSMQVCEVADIGDGNKRNVAIWQSDTGFVMCDGATISPISEDIRQYWDPNDSAYIPTDRQDDTISFYDPNLQSYKALISSGAGQTTHNVELEYSLKYQEWTKLYREDSDGSNQLQLGFPVTDTDGSTYTYGGDANGYVYRLENGKTWDSNPITEYLWTKPLLLDPQVPMWRHSVIKKIRMLFEDKATGAGEDIDIIYYCDGSRVNTGSLDQFVPTDIDLADGPYETRDCTLGPCLTHSFYFTSDISTVYDGMELNGLGIYFESLEAVREESIQ